MSLEFRDVFSFFPFGRRQAYDFAHLARCNYLLLCNVLSGRFCILFAVYSVFSIYSILPDSHIR